MLISVLACAATAAFGQGTPRVASTKVLSERGSTRATRYMVSNKIVTIDGKTHITWLDSISEIMVATYDHAGGTWGEPVHVGSGTDNHGGPALLSDSGGHLHIIFGPHAGPFHHCVSAQPNNTAEWTRQEDFGVDGTYPSAVFDTDDTLHIIYRGGPYPAKRLVYQRKPEGQPWSGLTDLAASPLESGYTHFHSSLAIAPDQSLHVAYDIFYDGVAKCAGYLTSSDRGDTWTLADGGAAQLPITPDQDAFFRRDEDQLTVASIVCDSAGRPWVSLTRLELWLFDAGEWRVIRPAATSPFADDVGSGAFGTLTIDARDRLYWLGPIGREYQLFYSADAGQTWSLHSVAKPLPDMPLMGPSLERPTGHNTVTVPWALFSHGPKGPDLFGEGIHHRVTAAQLSSK